MQKFSNLCIGAKVQFQNEHGVIHNGNIIALSVEGRLSTCKITVETETIINTFNIYLDNNKPNATYFDACGDSITFIKVF